MNKIDLVVMVKNEEVMLPRMLDSVDGLVYNKIVVDTGSTDGTLDICKKYDCQVIHNPEDWHIGIFAKNKNIALEHASSEWVLNLDADEEITEKLFLEIKDFIDKDKDALRIRRRHIHRNGETCRDRVIRLFRRSSGYKFQLLGPDQPHELPSIGESRSMGNYQNSENEMNHWGFFYISKEDFITKKERYIGGYSSFDIMDEQFGLKSPDC